MISRLLAAILLATTTFLGGRSHAAGRPGLHARYVVIVVLDGARPDYFNLTNMPNMAKLAHQGVTYTSAFVGQEMANTPPSHATIGTGVFPSRHGVEGFIWADPRSGLAIRPADLAQVRAGDLENIISAHHVPSISAAIKNSDRTARIVSVSGHKCYAADAMGTAAADYILCAQIYHGRWVAQAIPSHEPPPGAVNNSHWDVPIPSPSTGFAPSVEQWNLGSEDDWTVRYGLWAFKTVHYPRALMINLPEIDVVGHFTGTNTSPEKTLMQHFDRELGWLVSAYKRAGIFDQTLWVVTADHGMDQVQARIPFTLLDRAIQLAGATKTYIEADTSAAIGIREPQKARAVALQAARMGATDIDATFYKVFKNGTFQYRLAFLHSGLPVQLRRAFQVLADTDASESGPDVIVNYAPHITTGDRPAYQYHWLAGHLGPQWDEQHIPLYVAGPGIKLGYVSTYPARLVDLAPTIERAMGLHIGDVDGIVLADAFAHPSKIVVQVQAEKRAVLGQVVTAIRARSG
jgi:Type I phosphodiesterase / nucleotide pyrophosphatase